MNGVSEGSTIPDIFSLTLLLFAVMDPLGNIPLFNVLLNKLPANRYRMVIIREHLIAIVLLFLFYFFGQIILGFFGIKPNALNLSGGVLLFIIAIKMMFHGPNGMFGEESEMGEPLVFPLAVPLIAGPSTIATVMLFSFQHSQYVLVGSLALVFAWTASLIVLLYYRNLNRFIGTRGITAMKHLMALILSTLAVQMILNGIGEFIRTLPNNQ